MTANAIPIPGINSLPHQGAMHMPLIEANELSAMNAIMRHTFDRISWNAAGQMIALGDVTATIEDGIRVQEIPVIVAYNFEHEELTVFTPEGPDREYAYYGSSRVLPEWVNRISYQHTNGESVVLNVPDSPATLRKIVSTYVQMVSSINGEEE